MTVQAIDSLSAVSSTSPYAAKRNDELDKMDFLKLLIAQLQQQDPLNPEDPTEFTAQLTQFSSLEQMMAMNQAIQDLQMLQLSTSNTLAAALIGKDVVFPGNELAITGSRAPDILFRSGNAVKNVTVTIKDAQGRVVRTIELDNAKQGQNAVAWDGKDSEGALLADGTYTVSITAGGSSEDAVALETLQKGRVTGIVFKDGQTYLDVEGKDVIISDIISVHEPSAA